MEIIDKHLLTQIRLLYKCACKDIYVKYLVTYLEGTQQTTINPYELIVIPTGSQILITHGIFHQFFNVLPSQNSKKRS